MESFFGNPWEMGTGFVSPMTNMPGAASMPVMPQVDIATEMAKNMAARGIRPDQFYQNPQVALPDPAPAGGNVWDPTPVATPGGLPSNVAQGAPSAMDANAAGSTTDAAKSGEKSFGDKLQDSLKGVKMPTPPTPQTVRTPSAPEPKGQIKTGDLLAMMMAMQPGTGGMKLPQTLGASLAGVYK